MSEPVIVFVQFHLISGDGPAAKEYVRIDRIVGWRDGDDHRTVYLEGSQDGLRVSDTYRVIVNRMRRAYLKAGMYMGSEIQ